MTSTTSKGAALTSQSIINELPAVEVYHGKLNPCRKEKETSHMAILSHLKASCFPVMIAMAGIFKHFLSRTWNRMKVIQSLLEI